MPADVHSPNGYCNGRTKGGARVTVTMKAQKRDVKEAHEYLSYLVSDATKDVYMNQ